MRSVQGVVCPGLGAQRVSRKAQVGCPKEPGAAEPLRLPLGLCMNQQRLFTAKLELPISCFGFGTLKIL